MAGVFQLPHDTDEQVLAWGDARLRVKASAVVDFDGALADLVARMKAVVAAHDGLGLAATQLGIQRRVLVWRVDGATGAIVNPEIVEASRSTTSFREGCLSVPGVALDVVRPKRVVATGFDEHGEAISIADDELLARVLLHEVDHLDGVLMVDRVDPEQKRIAVAAYNRRL